MSSLVVPFSSAITKLGLGYDTTNGQVKGSPFEGDVEIETVQFHSNSLNEDGPEQMAVQYKMRFIEQRSDLAENLDISGRFSAQKGNISGSLSGGFLDRELDTKSKVYVLISVEVLHSITAISGIPNIDPIRVPGHPQASVDTNEKAFFDNYGDTYVAAVQIGGRLDGLVEITASSSDDLQRIKAEAKAEVKGLGGVELSLDFVVGRLTEDRQTTVTVNGVGGGISFSPMDARSFVRLAKTFPIMVNGGESKITEFDIKTVDQVQSEIDKTIRFPGIAVPVRAVISAYKALPIFSYSPSTLTRLSNYVTEDLIEYYLSNDNAKGRITDLLENVTGDFNFEDLNELEVLRSKVRLEQSEILVAIDSTNQAQNADGAETATEHIAKLRPGEWFLLKASDVSRRASHRLESEQIRKAAEIRKREELKVAAKQRLESYASNVVKLETEQIFSDDRIVIATEDEKFTLMSAKGKNKYIWQRPSDEVTFSDVLQLKGVTELETDLKDFHTGAMNVIRGTYYAILLERLNEGEISLDEYVLVTDAVTNASNREYLDWAMSIPEVWYGKENFRAIAKEGCDMVLSHEVNSVGDLVNGEGFYIEIVDPVKGIVRIRNERNLYWRHRLQWIEYGIVTLEDIEGRVEDMSFMFKVVSVSTGNLEGFGEMVHIEPEGGSIGWKLFSYRENGASNLRDVIASRPGTVDGIEMVFRVAVKEELDV